MTADAPRDSQARGPSGFSLELLERLDRVQRTLRGPVTLEPLDVLAASRTVLPMEMATVSALELALAAAEARIATLERGRRRRRSAAWERALERATAETPA